MKIHCHVVSEVMTELGLEYMPGVRLVCAEDFEPVVVQVKAARARSPWLQEVLRSTGFIGSENLEATVVKR